MSSAMPDPLLSTGSSTAHAPPTDEETVYYAGSPLFGGTPERVLGLATLGTLFLLSPIIYRFVSHDWPTQVFVLGLLVIGALLWAASWFFTKVIKYRISNYRIDYERGFLSKDISTLELWHVEDISFHQSLLDRMFSMGSIRVMANDRTMPDLHMRGLPGARNIFEELKQRIIAVKRQSGVLKLDTGT